MNKQSDSKHYESVSVLTIRNDTIKKFIKIEVEF